jgi:uncharacterized lipoprotein YddW (UPF0748 family)
MVVKSVHSLHLPTLANKKGRMKHTLFALLIHCLLLSHAAPAQERNHYTCYRTAGPITADGFLSEPDWSLADWSEDFVDITGNPELKPPMRTRIKMLWDDRYIYVAAELIETGVWATLEKHDAVIFHDNDFEIFLDPEGNGRNYAEIEVNALGTVWDLLLTRAYKDGGKPVSNWDLRGLQTGIRVCGTLNDPSSADTSWIVEMALPIEELTTGRSLSCRPADGVMWRVNFSRVEWETEIVKGAYRKVKDPVTGKPVPERNWVWSPMGEIAMHIPERWGRLEFSSENIAGENIRFLTGLQEEGFRKWAWLGGHQTWTAAKWDSVMSDCRSMGITGILTQADSSTLVRIIPIAGRHGIEVQKWFVAMMNNDPDLLREHPDWFVVNREGRSCITDPAYVGYYRFFCPSHPGVIRYLEASIDGYLAIPGLAGIHLDYIRYPDVILPEALWPTYGIIQDREYPAYDYCYCPVCKEQFRSETGQDLSTMTHPETSEAWRKYRYERVTAIVQRLADQCHNAGRKISAAVFPGPSTAKRLVRQSWDEWPLDEVFPMLYQDFYYGNLDWIRLQTSEGTLSAGTGTPLFSGLYIPSLTPRELQTAIRKSILGNAAGICLFSYESLTPEHRRILKEAFLPKR